MDTVFGLGLANTGVLEIPAEVLRLLDERAAARAAKDFRKSDEIREQINAAGFIVTDTKEGQVIKETAKAAIEESL
jgi:cysteinyl-tRNA synthetase